MLSALRGRLVRPSNPDTPVGWANLNPPFGLGIHPSAEKLSTRKDERMLLPGFTDG
jgi:hypothetical protein